MRGVGFVLVGVSLGIGAADWVAVARGNRRAEYFLKPLTLALLILSAAFLKPGVPMERWTLTLIALALSLAGDVFLMPPQDLFVAEPSYAAGTQKFLYQWGQSEATIGDQTVQIAYREVGGG